MSKYCMNCGRELSDEALFCTRCGLNIENISKLTELTAPKKKKKQSIAKVFLLFVLILLAFVPISYFGYEYLIPVSTEQVKDSVVMLKVYNENNEEISQGSGFCAFEDDVIVTNFHVIEGAYRIAVIDDEQKSYKVNDILIFDKANDLAILEGDYSFKSLRIRDSSQLNVNDELTTISSPRGNLNIVSPAKVVDFKNEGIIMESEIQPGSSGGAVLNSMGKVVGIASAILGDDQNLSYAINVKTVAELYSKYKEGDYGAVSFLNYEGIYSFIPNIFDDVEGSELRINNTWTITEDKVYQPDSLYSFYTLTDETSILRNALEKFPQNLSRLGDKYIIDKEVTSYYNMLRSYDRWWFGDENTTSDETKYSINDSPLQWDECQYVLDLKVMRRIELACFLDILPSIVERYNEDFKPINQNIVYKYFNVENEKKNIVAMIFSGFEPSDFTKEENRKIIELLWQNMPSSATEEERAFIFERIGYTYNNGSVSW